MSHLIFSSLSFFSHTILTFRLENSRTNVTVMRWQFGGNLQPVRMICEFDWRECPSAILNYIWSEIVTDVVECLTNEWMIWRVIAMLFVCSVLIHTIYSKTKLINETSINRKNLNVVGCKVQDLELKVNILTYKMQYGTWPLPRQIHGSGVERQLRNVRLTLTNSNERNAWIKHMLLSPSENSSCVPYAKIGPRSVRCLTKLINLETKYMSSKFEGDNSPVSTKERTSRMGSDKSLGYENASGEILGEEEARKKLGKSENLGMRNREMLENGKNNCWSETQVSKYRETSKWPKNETKKSSKKSSRANKTPEERVNATHETLHQVCQKLENLHSVLRIYGQPRSEKNASNKELAETILRELKNLGNLAESEGETKSKKCVDSGEGNGDLTSEEFSKKAENPVAESSSEFEQCHSEPDFSSWSNQGEEKKEGTSAGGEKAEKIPKTRESINFPKNYEIPEFPKSEMDEKMLENENLSNFSKKLEKNDSDVKKNGESTRIPKNLDDDDEKKMVEFSKFDKIAENQGKALIEEPTIPSPISSTAEFSKDSDTDEKSNASLLREAVKFKNALIDQMGMENVVSGKLRSPRSEEESSESEETMWSKSKLHFQPKSLDIISEEHSASSSTEKGTKIREKNNFSDKIGSKIAEATGSSLEILESKSSTKIDWEKWSGSGKNLEKIEKKNSIEKMDFGREKKATEVSRDLTSLVNESVLNIREYIEAFSQIQKEAIVEAKMSLREEKNDFFEETGDFSSIPEEKSSLEGVTCFLSPVGLTESEEMARKLSEPLIRRSGDSEVEISEEDSSGEPRRVDLSLRRRPGSTSLAGAQYFEEKSIFESANSLEDGEDDLTTDFSCKQLNDYSSLSTSDVTNEKQLEKDFDEGSRVLDTPLTGRTVIRATGSSTSNLEVSAAEDKDVEGQESEKTDNCDSEQWPEQEVDGESSEVEDPATTHNPDRYFQPEVVQETSSTYFTDQASFPDMGAHLLEIPDEKFRPEDDNSLYEEKFSPKPEVEPESEVFVEKTDTRPENSSPRSKPEDFPVPGSEVSEPGPETRVERPEVAKKWSKIDPASQEGEKIVKIDSKKKGQPEVTPETAENRPNSSETFVINSPRSKSRTSEISNLLTDASTLYMDANSRDFLNVSGTSLRLDKGFLGSSKSARGLCSSPLRQSVPWNTPRRGSSLTSSERSRRSSEKLEKPKESEKSSKNLGNSTKSKNSKIGSIGLGARSHLTLNGTKDLESSSFGRRNVTSNNGDLRDRRSRSDATPRKSDSSPRSSTNLDFPGPQRLSRDRKSVPKCEKIDAKVEKMKKENASTKNSPKISICGENKSRNNGERVCEIDTEECSGSLRKNSATFPSGWASEKLAEAEKPDSTRISPAGSGETTKIVKSTLGLSKNGSKSSIPVLRSRLEAVRQTGQEKRSKSPSRCALTMSTSCWSQENRSVPLFPAFEHKKLSDDLRMESRRLETDSRSLESVAEATESEMMKKATLPESRTVIYVNIVTEQEHKSATRIVDPKKFLEYLKDRDLKIQSVQDQEIPVERVETSSPRILTIVSSAVEEKMHDKSGESSRAAGWSLRVEKREIEVSAKPSVIDTSTSISDLPDSLVKPSPSADSKFQIFQVPKELTKDEYILLLETLNQDPNLHQLREMHYLCNKLGLGFNE